MVNVTLEDTYTNFLLYLFISLIILILITRLTKSKLQFTFISTLAISSFYSLFSLLILDTFSLTDEITYFIYFLVLNTSVIFAISYYLYRRIVKPIQDLDNRTKKMAEGDLISFDDHKLKGIGETGRLAYTTSELGKRYRGMISNIKRSATEQSNAANSMAAGSEQVSSTTVEISSTISSIAENASLQVRALDDVSSILSDMVTVIDESIREIGITSRITLDLAEQTNLVALNASIEAAKAGDAGQGFNVVAEHVRQLSIESKTAANTVNTIIKNIDFRIRDSVNGIVEAVEKVASVAENTAASSQEAAAATEEQSASLQEISEQANKLSILSEKTEREISEFVISR